MSATPPTPSARQRKKAQTRKALVEAAWGLFHLHGFEGTTVDAIAAAAGVGRRTVFRYFATKEDLFFSDHEERLTRFAVLLAAREPDERPVASVQRAFIGLAETLMAARERELLRNEMITGSDALMAADRVRDLEWEAAVARALGGDRDARVQAGALFGAVRATLREWYDGGCEEDLVVLGLQAFGLLGRGIR